jgi:ferredoxin
VPVKLRLVAAHRSATLDAAPGARLYDLIRGAGWPLGSSCRGEGVCGRCALQVDGPAAALAPEGDDEARLKRREGLQPGAVLACLRAAAPCEEDLELAITTTYW